MQISVQKISKTFNRVKILTDVSFDVREGEVFGITGRNGSGKSTLLKIAAGLITPSRGSVAYALHGNPIAGDRLYRHIGFVAPYLNLYDEFNAEENLAFFASARGLPYSRAQFRQMLENVGLPSGRKDPIRAFSSGMKQRMKLLFATIHQPAFLLLDEPISNLDADGITVVYSIIGEQRKRGCTLLASNDKSDIAKCDRTVHLGE